MSARSVLEANVQVLVEYEYKRPAALMAIPPVERPLMVRDEVAVSEPMVA